MFLLAFIILTSPEGADGFEDGILLGILKSNYTGEGLGMFLGWFEKRNLSVWLIALTRIIIGSFLWWVVSNKKVDKLNP